MRIGIIALLHESNTFVRQKTSLDRFRDDLFLSGDDIRESLSGSHHEVGGFLAGIDMCPDATAVPLVAYRATPSGVITADAFQSLMKRVLASVQGCVELDGILVAVHGAAVSEDHADADGEWLARLRELVGTERPIIGTLDAHANLSEKMVRSCDALIGYRTNPHLDQRARGLDAAQLMISTLRNEVRPTMAATFPPMVIGIQRQCTDEPHLRSIYEFADHQLQGPGVLSNSVLLGFPYADVAEMGVAAIAITNADKAHAIHLAGELGHILWDARHAMVGYLVSVDEALDQCAELKGDRICLLDMGDNVGGGSAADGTILIAEIMQKHLGPTVACIYDPQAVAACNEAGVGSTISLTIGGKTDDQHGPPLSVFARVNSLNDGRFHEDRPRHGGIVEFDQGRTAVVELVDQHITVVLTSRRMAPFSLRQLTSCGIDPKQYRILVAKGVNAPLAAYREVCDTFIRVNTAGSTCADVMALTYEHRRRPLFPFESDAEGIRP